MKYKHKEQLTGWIFILPSLILISTFLVYPIFRAFLLSFQDYNLLNADASKYIFLDNYKKALTDPIVRVAFKNTIIYSLGVVPIQLIIAFALSLVINAKIKGQTFFRVAYYLPTVTSTVAVGVIFLFLFKADGLVNKILGTNIAWFNNPKFALPAIMFMAIWTSIGQYMIIYLAGLQDISEDLYEAAEIDGATKWKKIRYITLPLLKPTTLFNLVMSIIGCLQMFDQSFVISKGEGGPLNSTMTVVLYIYRQAFKNQKMGYACAIAFILFILIMAITVVQRLILDKRVVD